MQSGDTVTFKTLGGKGPEKQGVVSAAQFGGRLSVEHDSGMSDIHRDQVTSHTPGAGDNDYTKKHGGTDKMGNPATIA